MQEELLRLLVNDDTLGLQIYSQEYSTTLKSALIELFSVLHCDSFRIDSREKCVLNERTAPELLKEIERFVDDVFLFRGKILVARGFWDADDGYQYITMYEYDESIKQKLLRTIAKYDFT